MSDICIHDAFFLKIQLLVMHDYSTHIYRTRPTIEHNHS